MHYIFEDLSPQLYEKDLQNRKNKLEKVIKNRTVSLSKAPEGRIRCLKRDNHLEFYLMTKKGDTTGKYLPRNQDLLAKKIIQRDYNKKILVFLKKEHNLLTKLLRFYGKNYINSAEKRFSDNRRKYIDPVTLTDDAYSKMWQKEEYSSKGFTDETVSLYTFNGLRVRSKSEVIIANTLDHYGIPFRYEYPLTLKTEQGNYVDFYPDFYCLNVRTRKEIIWEHFGMMDDLEYCEKTLRKIQIYEANGYFAGQNFIFTMETSAQPLSAKELELKIKTFLL